MSSKPRPVPTPITQPYWDALNDERIVVQRCDACGGWVHYPRRRCSHCLADALSWQPVSTTGSLYTFSIARQPTNAAFVEDVPLVIAVVELDDGPRVTANVVGVDADTVRVGMRLNARFDHGDDGITLLQFVPG